MIDLKELKLFCFSRIIFVNSTYFFRCACHLRSTALSSLETSHSRSQQRNSLTFSANMEPSAKSEGKNNMMSIFRRGNTGKTKGTAFVVYEDIYDAKNAVDHLNGFNVAGKYLICLYYQAHKQA